MKRTNIGLAMVLAALATALPARAGGLSSSYNDDSKNISFNTYQYSGSTTLSSYFSTKGSITDVGVYYSVYSLTPNTVTVGTYIDGIKEAPPYTTFQGSQGMNFTSGGLSVSEYVSSDFYDANGGMGKGSVLSDASIVVPTPTDWWAYGQANLTVSGITPIYVSGNSWYSENVDPNTFLTDQFWSPSWQLTFSSPADASAFANDLAGMGVTNASSVPEPASLGLLSLAGLVLVRRRRAA